MGAAFSLKTCLTKLRATHTTGVGAAGFAFVIDNPDLPESDFFTPGRAFRVRMRHGNFLGSDDAMCDGRSASFKFDDVQSGGPLDLIMNSTDINFFQNIPTCETFAKFVRRTDDDVLHKAYYATPHK